MAASKGFVDYVCGQLFRLGPVASKRMFGGAGLYYEGLIFGLVSSEDVLYLKVDETNRARFEERGCTIFAPMPGRPALPYMSVPEDVLEDPAEFAEWAREALAVSRRKAR